MSSAQIAFFDVYIKGYNGRLTQYQNQMAYVQKYDENRAVMSFYEQHDDGDEFMYLDLVFCEEAKVIYVMDYYGYNFHSWEDTVEYMPHNENARDESLRVCSEILKKMYGYTMRVYNKGAFNATKQKHINIARDQTFAIAPLLPMDISRKIYQTIVPNWTGLSRKFWKGRWAPYMDVRHSYENAMELFYSVVPNLRTERLKAFYLHTGVDVLTTLTKVVLV